MARTWIITGAGTGFGFKLTEYALGRGDNVVIGARRLETVAALAAAHPDAAAPVQLDVTDDSQRKAAVDTALEKFGAIDVLVNNAGTDFVGAVEEQEEKDFRAVFEVNFFGAVGMIRAALPTLRSQGSGTIVNISSEDGIAGLPANAFYSASKFALEGLSDALAVEVRDLGIHVLLVEPGAFRTGIVYRTRASGAVIAAYDKLTRPFRDAVANPAAADVDLNPGDPERAVPLIYAEATSASPRRRLILGSDSLENISRAVASLQQDINDNTRSAALTDDPAWTGSRIV